MTKKTKINHSRDIIVNSSFPDLVRINIQAIVGRPKERVLFNKAEIDLREFELPSSAKFQKIESDYLSLSEDSKVRRCRLYMKDSRRGSVLRHENFDIVSVRIRFNGQEELRRIAFDLLGLDKAPKVIWGQSKNYISAQIYKRLEEKGVELSFLQEQVLQALNKRIQKACNQMKRDYFRLFGVHIKDSKIMIYLKQVEISADIVGPVSYEMARDLTFKRQFDEMIHNHQIAYFKKRRKHLIADLGSESADGFANVKQVVGYYHGDVVLKAYLKSVDQWGSTNRGESKYCSKSLDKLLYWGRWIPYDGDMPLFGVMDRIRDLISLHADMFHAVLSHKPLSQRPKYRKRIKLAIKHNCGVHAADITKIYLKWRKLSTGKGTPLSAGANALIRKLCREGKVFKKSKKFKASYYMDKRYLNTFYGRF